MGAPVAAEALNSTDVPSLGFVMLCVSDQNDLHRQMVTNLAWAQVCASPGTGSGAPTRNHTDSTLCGRQGGGESKPRQGVRAKAGS